MRAKVAVVTGGGRGIPLQRLAPPDKAAAAVRFLASDEASCNAGRVLSVNGGLNMAG